MVTTHGTLSKVTARRRKYVLSGILLTSWTNVSKFGVGTPLTAVMKFVGESPYW